MTATSTQKKLRIVYSEDSPAEQEMLKRLLSNRGHEVTCCDDGRTALRAIMAQTHDVLITDNDMPHMNGLDLVRELRQIQSPIKIVVTSGYLEAEVEAKYRALGIDRFLPKPASDEEVFQAVEGD